jgi:GNAT superfamily N-acetyltransferase
MMNVISVGQSEAILESFLALPYELYHDQPCWTPRPVDETVRLLDPSRSPFWRQAERELFVALDSGQVVGRIIAADDPIFVREHGTQTGFFGFFECIDDPSVAKALLEAAAHWLRQRGRHHMRGPFNPVPDAENFGLLIDGCDHPQAFGEPYNPPFYQFLLETHGLTKLVDYLSFRHALLREDNPKGSELRYRLERRLNLSRDLSVRTFDPAHLDRDIMIMKEIMNTCYATDLVYSRASSEVEKFILNSFEPLEDWSLSFIVEVRGEPAGIWVTTPDYNEAYRAMTHSSIKALTAADAEKIRGGCVPEFAVLPKFRRSKAAVALVLAYWEATLKRGFDHNIICYVREDNHDSIAMAEGFGAVRMKRFRLYETSLTDSY